MSMIVHSPHGRSRRSRFASTVAKPCQRPKSLKSHRDVISHVEKGQGQYVQHNCNGPVNTAVTPWGSYGGDTRWATELSATRGAPNPRYFELIALDIFLQTAYCLLNLSHIALYFPSGHNALLLEWLGAYCDTHQVYFLRHIALTNNLPKQGLVPSVHMLRPDQAQHAETGKAFLVQRQAVYKHNPLWRHKGSQCPDLDSLQYHFVLASYYQANLAHMVNKANGDINCWQKGQLLQVSGCHRVRLRSLNPRGKSKHKVGHKREIGLGRPCTSNKVHTVRFRGILTENESIYLNYQDKERLLYLKMEVDVLGKALNFRTFKSLKAKTILHSNTLLMLAKYMVKGSNCNKVEQEGELGSPQEGPSSKKDQTEQQRDAAKRQERSKTSAGKKRSTGSAGHPNDEDDLNDPGKDGDTSRKRSKKRAKECGSKFACPFFKHDPERYKTTRSCMGPGWTNVHRVKEHIFRSHCEPPYKCFRCHSAFKTEDELSGHQRQAVPCKVFVPESQDRYGLSTINIDTEKRLRSRKTNKALTEEEKWFNMYHIIFPDHSPPSSPYHSDTEDMAQFLHRSAGPIIRQTLRARLETVLADSLRNSFSRIVDDIVHEAMASLTSAFLNNRDIDGKDTETSESPLPAGTFDYGFSARTSVATNCFDAVSSNAEPPNELESLPQSVNDSALHRSTVADSCHMDLFSTASQPQIDSSSGIKGLGYSLGSGEYTDNEKASAPISHLDSEDQLKVGTDGPRRTILREPVIPHSPSASQSIVHERPSGYTYGNGCLHGAGDSSHRYRESCQGGDQGNDSGDLIVSDIGLWNSIEQLGDSCDHVGGSPSSWVWLTESI